MKRTGTPELAADGCYGKADRPERLVSTFSGEMPALRPTRPLRAMAERYRDVTAHMVAMQLEYSRSRSSERSFERHYSALIAHLA
jgi:hypothetical protein